MYPGYWDDYMNDGTPDADKIHNVYQITLNGVSYGSLKKAAEATGQMGKWALMVANSHAKIDLLKKCGANVQIRQYNDSKKRWETDEFISI